MSIITASKLNKSFGIETVLEERRRHIEARIMDMDAETLERIRERRLKNARALYQSDLAAFEQYRQKRLIHLQILEDMNPDLAKRYQSVYQDILTFIDGILAHRR